MDHSNAGLPKQIEIDVSGSRTTYRIEGFLGGGGYGLVYVGKKNGNDNPELPKEVAVKFERQKKYKFGTPYEWEVYRALTLKGIENVPKAYYTGSVDDYYFMVMDKLKKIEIEDTKGNFRAVACIAQQAINTLKSIHSKGYVHGDVKPQNFLLKTESKEVILIDFGLASRWSQNVQYDQRVDGFRGTRSYASEHALLGKTLSRRDDLVSLAYSLINFYDGKLPWKFSEEDDIYFFCKKRKETNLGCVKESFKKFIEDLVKLGFDEEPQYDNYLSLFESQTEGSNPKPNQVKTENPKPMNLIYQTQWITILTDHRAMKQRYHHDVGEDMFKSLLDHGKKENLYISSIASSERGWTLIMDENLYSDQEYKYGSGLLIESKVLTNWVKEKWKENYYITSLGAYNGSSLVVMSMGVNYRKQIFTTCEGYPHKWICDNSKDGYFITALATSGHKWTVVMSRNACYSKQVVELDICFPEEGVKKRWNQGYRVTAIATSKPAQENMPQKNVHSGIPSKGCKVAVVMSVHKRNHTGERQVILRSPHFPKQNIKEYWSKTGNQTSAWYGKVQYVTSICYGPL